MSTKSVTRRYYPALSELITVDDLPDFLQFAESGLESLLNRIHYKNFQFSKSARGDSAFTSTGASLVSYFCAGRLVTNKNFYLLKMLS